jgi:Ser/Thr protein kinase RdoA (MazF antagonist)
MLARFHLAVWDYGGDLMSDRPPVHDFARHLQHLDTVMDISRSHRLHASARTLARELAGAVAQNPPFVSGPERLVHGDPKISNMLFEPDLHRAICLIDLDTLARMPLAFELGDALRSWCNPKGEDARDAAFRLDLFHAAVTAYLARAGHRLAPSERAAIVPATVQIHLELAARFLADALEERYFGWDPARYASRGEHNLARAGAQLAAARSLLRQYAEAQRIVDECSQQWRR